MAGQRLWPSVTLQVTAGVVERQRAVGIEEDEEREISGIFFPAGELEGRGRGRGEPAQFRVWEMKDCQNLGMEGQQRRN